MLGALDETCESFRATLHAYCVMPDYLHLLITIEAGVSMKEFVRIFKQTSGFRLKKLLGVAPWQLSYYDRVLRKEEAIEDVALYIWNNPVEGELAASALEYPWCGPRDMIQ